MLANSGYHAGSGEYFITITQDRPPVRRRAQALNVGDRVYSTLDIARLLPTFETYQDEAEAIRSFGAPAD